MRRRSLVWRVYAGVIALVAIAMTIAWVLASQGLAERTRDVVREQLTAEARMLRSIVRRGVSRDETALQARVRELGQEVGTRFTVIAPGGRVLADSRESPERMNNHADRPEVQAALRDGHGSSVRHSSTLDREMLYVALPVGGGTTPRIVVRTAVGLSAIDAQLGELRWALALTALAALGIALPLGYLLARSVTQPLTRLIAAAESIAEGHHDTPIPPPTEDELGDLARALDRMTADAKERIAASAADQANLRAILKSIAEGVLAVDRDERVLHCNAAAAQILRITADPPAQHHLWAVTRIAEVCEVLRTTARTGTAETREVRVVDGPREQVIEVRAAALRGPTGEPDGAVAVLHDVTQLHRLESIRRDFVANVSHELKTPITAVRGQVETMLDDPEMPDDVQRSFLEKMLAQTLRLSAIVSDLLTLSRLESADTMLEHVPLDLRDVVRVTVAPLRALAETRGITLAVEFSDSSVPVQGDQVALEQAVRNLVENALKYTPEGGRVTVRSGAENGHVLVEVEDTGPGIPPEHRARIFERFYRVDKARSRDLGGTGLGLSIVKHVCLAHGGDVTLRNPPGKGCTFRIRLPRDGRDSSRVPAAT